METHRPLAAFGPLEAQLLESCGPEHLTRALNALDAGANPKAQLAPLGNTALMLAAWNDNPMLAHALLRHSEPDARNYAGHTALMLAARANSIRCARILLPASSPSLRDLAGRCASDLARESGFTELANLIDGAFARAEARQLADQLPEAPSRESPPRV